MSNLKLRRIVLDNVVAVALRCPGPSAALGSIRGRGPVGVRWPFDTAHLDGL
eukprot:gene10520-7306_t